MPVFKAVLADAGVRADIFISQKYPAYTRSSLEKLFDEDSVTINERSVRPAYKLKAGDKLFVDDKLITAKPPKIDIPIIYEDNDVIVLNKPEGVLTHSKGALNTEATVASFIKPRIDKELDGNRAGIVHRLDRATSGVMIAAKNQASLSWLQKQFSSRKTKKTYTAVVEGVLEPTQALIDAPIVRNPKKPQTFAVMVGGKPSQTEYKVTKTIEASKAKFSLLELKPRTGRTHQIRIHLNYINHPIVGDAVYGHPGKHMLLHAGSLELTMPDKSRKVFSADEPDYFKEFIS